MSSPRFTSVLLVLTILICAAAGKKTPSKPADLASHPPKEKKNDPSHALFSTNAPIHTFKIEVSGNELAALQKDNRSYVHGTVTVGATVLKDVAIHLKGNGSFRPLNEKPSLVIKFDRFVPGQKLFGETKIALNNSSQDGTYLADFMANEMFREANVPVSRVTHARVLFNGRDLGLYVLVEMHNKEFLKRWFHNAQGNLYEAYIADVDSTMDLDNGVDKSQADRKKLVEVLNLPDPAARWARLPQVLDVDRYLSHLVCELFIGHTDGYAMNRNNYRIYHNPDTDRFTFLAHGADWAFQNTGVSMQPPQNSLVTRAVLTTPEGARLFKERRLTLFTNVFQLDDLTNRVNCVGARLLTVARNANETNDFRRVVAEMNQHLVARWQNLTNQLYGPPPLPLKFDAAGLARLEGWRMKTDPMSPPALHERLTNANHRTLHISTVTNATVNAGTVASWRTRVLLPPGIYLFEGDLRGTGIVSRTNVTDIGFGAGLRVSGDKLRENMLLGTAPWTHLQHRLTNAVEDSVELVCELRALRGEVWFDEDSLRLVKQPPPVPGSK